MLTYLHFEVRDLVTHEDHAAYYLRHHILVHDDGYDWSCTILPPNEVVIAQYGRRTRAIPFPAPLVAIDTDEGIIYGLTVAGEVYRLKRDDLTRCRRRFEFFQAGKVGVEYE